MLELLRFVLLSLGVTYILSRSSIGQIWRVSICSAIKSSLIRAFVGGLIYCPACTGFWVGLGLQQFWPWGGYWVGLQAAIASCALGSLAGSFWPALQEEMISAGLSVALEDLDDRLEGLDKQD